MAQLPPKIPSWHNPFRTGDEFLDFSIAKRSLSDSVAFVQTSLGDFERLDDVHLMSIFSENVPPPPPPISSSGPSSPSDHNSVNEDQSAAVDSQEAFTGCKIEPNSEPARAVAGAEPTVVDPKRVKRILANRQSAQRSRVRKLQYISELERCVTALQSEVSALSPRVAFLDHQRSMLTAGNGHLKQRIAALAQDKLFKDAHQEALKKEIERLRQVYHQQNLQKIVAPISEAIAVQSDKE